MFSRPFFYNHDGSFFGCSFELFWVPPFFFFFLFWGLLLSFSPLSVLGDDTLTGGVPPF